MTASPEAFRAIRTVAVHLDDLCTQVVFVGGVVRGLMVTGPAVEGSRATKDVDVIAAGITTLVGEKCGTMRVPNPGPRAGG